MIDFKIKKGLSSLIFSEPGIANPRLVLEAGCWYLCVDTAELFLGIEDAQSSHPDGISLKRINATDMPQIPVDNLASKNDVESAKQEVIQTIIPNVEEVKTKVETVLIPKVEEEIVPTVTELKSWIENKEFLQYIDLEGYASEEYVNDKFDSVEQNYVTNDEVAGLVANEIESKVSEQVETKVTEVIQEKVDNGEITVAASSITYGDF